MTWCATAQVTAPGHLNSPTLLGHSRWLSVVDLPDIGSEKFCRMQWHYRIPTSSLSEREIARYQRQQQRAGVRLLLKSLLNKLDIIDNLDDSSFPYRLVNSQYYVCFSHTGAHNKSTHSKMIATQRKNEKLSNDLNDKVAVVISAHRPAGIDIEANNVAWQVAQRFYHTNEIAILQTLSTIERNSAAKLLWQIKESVIKIHQYKLAQGLGMDYSYLITDLVNRNNEKTSLIVINDTTSNYHIALLFFQQTVIVY
ncbi:MULTISPECIES: 4'-phosphopantetheinyl transferase family protein [unclassified Psychrobacter]|uniref:4'-phosphopantetheinyl transferase family protein n=1 Tax=unclassified Psychrobacter TaxID=196806 RepID=UPI0025EE8DF0|nr:MULTISPECIES: 4'-phosphopantetheinyl transferase superfamily protein [unclassified Psychrobacter]